MMIPTILTIAGTDPTGGAGIVADIKTISALGGYALSVPTAIIAQNSYKVGKIMTLSENMIREQLRYISYEFPISAVKIGMLGSYEALIAVHSFLETLSPHIPVVFDPVLASSSGYCLFDKTIDLFDKDFFSHISLVTPNLNEIAYLLGCPIATTRHDMRLQAERLKREKSVAVLLKGGHLKNDVKSPDLLLKKDGTFSWHETSKIITTHGRGTGCTLSSALAFFLIQYSLDKAVEYAKNYLYKTLRTAERLNIVKEKGPLNHFLI